MFGPLGVPELLFILVLALLIFGPKKLPEIGRTVGKAMGEFRRASSELRRTINTEIALEEDETRSSANKAGTPTLRAPAVDSESEPRVAAEGGPAAVAPEAPAVAAPPAGDEAPAGDEPSAIERPAVEP